MDDYSTEKQRDRRLVGHFVTGARKDALVYFPASLVPSLVGALSTVVFTRLLLPEAWGHYALALALAHVAITAQSSWLERSTLRFLGAADGTRAHTAQGGPSSAADNPIWLPLRLTVWNALLILAAALIAAGAVSIAFDDTVGIALATLLFAAASVASRGLAGIQRALLRAWPVTWSSLVASTLGFAISLLAVTIIGAHPGFLVLGPAMGILVAALLQAHDLLARHLGLHRSGWRAGVRKGWADRKPELDVTVRTYLAYGLPLTGFSVAGWLLHLSDRLIIFGLRGAAEAGIYAPNYALGSMLVGLVAVPVSTAAAARILRLSDAGAHVVQETVTRSSRDFLMIGTPLTVWLAVSAHDIASILLGFEFRVGSDVIPLVGAATLLWALGMYGHKGLEVKGKTTLMLLLAVVCGVVNVALNFVLVPRFGYVGAGWSTLASFAMYPFLAYIATLRVLRWRLPWRTILWLVVGGGVSTLAVRLGIDPIAAIGPVGRAAVSAVLTFGITAGVMVGAGEIRVGALRSYWAAICGRFGRRGASKGSQGDE